jgi:hypothetical protein
MSNTSQTCYKQANLELTYLPRYNPLIVYLKANLFYPTSYMENYSVLEVIFTKSKLLKASFFPPKKNPLQFFKQTYFPVNGNGLSASQGITSHFSFSPAN